MIAGRGAFIILIVRVSGPWPRVALARRQLEFAGCYAALPKGHYIPDAMWDAETETWFTTVPVFDLWVVGNLSHPGVGPEGILDVHMAAAYWSDEGFWGGLGGSGKISIAASSAEIHTIPEPLFDLYDPFGTPVARIDGAVPIMEDGQPLPTHGVYGPGVMFDQFYLDDFDGGGRASPTWSPSQTSMGQAHPFTMVRWGRSTSTLLRLRVSRCPPKKGRAFSLMCTITSLGSGSPPLVPSPTMRRPISLFPNLPRSCCSGSGCLVPVA